MKGGVPAARGWGRGHRLRGRFGLCGYGPGRRGLRPGPGSGAGGLGQREERGSGKSLWRSVVGGKACSRRGVEEGVGKW